MKLINKNVQFGIIVTISIFLLMIVVLLILNFAMWERPFSNQGHMIILRSSIGISCLVGLLCGVFDNELNGVFDNE